MSWAEAVGRLDDSVLAAFGQPATVHHGATDTTVSAIVETAEERFNNRAQSGAPGEFALDGAVLQRSDSMMTVMTGELAASGADIGDFVTVGARRYRIVDILDDQEGMTTMVIRAAWR